MTIVYDSGPVLLTWDEARAKVRGDLWRTGTQGVPDDVCDRALHAALRKLESERKWLWLENILATLTADEDTTELRAPSSLGSVGTIAYLNGNSGYDVLEPAPLSVVRDRARGPYVGWPTFYALNGSKLHLDAKVRAGAQFELIFQARTSPDLAATVADPPITLTIQQTAVLALACADVAMGWLKDADGASRHMQRYTSHLETIENEEDQSRSGDGGGSIMPDTFYQAMTNRERC